MSRPPKHPLVDKSAYDIVGAVVLFQRISVSVPHDPVGFDPADRIFHTDPNWTGIRSPWRISLPPLQPRVLACLHTQAVMFTVDSKLLGGVPRHQVKLWKQKLFGVFGYWLRRRLDAALTLVQSTLSHSGASRFIATTTRAAFSFLCNILGFCRSHTQKKKGKPLWGVLFSGSAAQVTASDGHSLSWGRSWESKKGRAASTL